MRAAKREEDELKYKQSLKTCKGDYPLKGDKTFCIFCKLEYTEWREKGGLATYKICEECNFRRWKSIMNINVTTDIGGNIINN